MPRGRPARGVPCESCIRKASSGGQRSDGIDLCNECIAKLHQPPSAQRTPQIQPIPNQTLEIQSRQFIEAINMRNFEHPIWNLLAPDVQGCYLDTYAPTYGRDAHVNVLRAVLQETPDYYINVVSTTSTVNEQDGFIDVQLIVIITGRPSGIQRQAHSWVRWQRRNAQDGWICVCRVNA